MAGGQVSWLPGVVGRTFPGIRCRPQWLAREAPNANRAAMAWARCPILRGRHGQAPCARGMALISPGLWAGPGQRGWPSAAQRLSAMARQLYGFDARMAASLDEFYQPPERWAYKADQR